MHGMHTGCLSSPEDVRDVIYGRGFPTTTCLLIHQLWNSISCLLYSPHRLLHRKLADLRAAFPCSAKRDHTSQELGTLCTSASVRSSYYLPAINMPHNAQGNTTVKIWSMRCIESHFYSLPSLDGNDNLTAFPHYKFRQTTIRVWIESPVTDDTKRPGVECLLHLSAVQSATDSGCLYCRLGTPDDTPTSSPLQARIVVGFHSVVYFILESQPMAFISLGQSQGASFSPSEGIVFSQSQSETIVEPDPPESDAAPARPSPASQSRATSLVSVETTVISSLTVTLTISGPGFNGFSSAPEPSSSNSSASSHSHGSIVGPVVGTVVGVIALVLLSWFLIHRCYQSRMDPRARNIG